MNAPTPAPAKPTAILKAFPEDFVVHEVPAYAPSGAGEHLFVEIEKRDLSTGEAVRRLARALGVDPREVGVAGQKDRRAVTRQWLSLPRVDEDAVRAVEIEGLVVRTAARNVSKLRMGHLAANRFEVRLRGLDPASDGAVAAGLARLSTEGMPNYYGAQRFGRDGDNVQVALAWLRGETRPPRDRRMARLLASAVQSKLFNDVVAARLEDGGLGLVRRGELCRKEATGGLFVSSDPDVDQARADAWELSPTGPMVGPEMRWPEADAAAFEEAVLARSGLTPADLERLGRSAPGTRRPVRVRPTDVSSARDEAGLVVRFTLPPGSYATTLVDQLVDTTSRTAPGSGEPGEPEGEGDAFADEGR